VSLQLNHTIKLLTGFVVWIATLIVIHTLPVFASQNSQSSVNNSQLLDFGKPKVQFFDTYALGYHRQNFQMTVGSDNRIYVVNTQAVLVYDGVKWDSITPPTRKKYYGAVVSGDGRVYTADFNDIGYYESGHDGKWYFTSFSSLSKLPEFEQVLDVVSSGDSIIYLTRNYLFHYHPVKGVEWLKVNGASFSRARTAGEQIYVTNSDNEVYQYTPAVNALKKINLFGNNRNVELTALAATLKNDVLFSTAEGVFIQSKGSVKRFDKGLASWLHQNAIRTIKSLADGRILLGSKKKGLAFLDEQGQLIRTISKANGLEQNWITDIDYDASGNLWLSHGSLGVSRVELSGVSYFGEELGVENVESIIRYKNKLFLGSLTKNLLMFEPASNLSEQGRFVETGEYLGVWGFLSHPDGLFVAHSQGIALLNFNEDGSVEHQPLFETEVPYELIRSTKETDVIFAATTNGLLKIGKVNNQWGLQGKLSGLSLELNKVVEDKYQNLWLTSASGTIVRVTELDQWPNSPFKQFAEPELQDDFNTLAKLGDEIVINNTDGYFISDQAGNLSILKEATHWPQKYDNMFYRHFYENHHSTWITDGYRLHHVHTDKKNEFVFDESSLDRVRSNNIHAIHVDSNGVLFAGGGNGLMRVEPDYNLTPLTIIWPHIHQVSNLTTQEPYFGAADFGSNSIQRPLQPNDSDLRFEYGTLDYSEHDNLIYRYRLRGFLNDWSNWSKEQRADFTNIPAGDFIFEIQSKNDLDMKSEIVSFSLSRLPFWYETFWFRTFLLLASIMLIVWLSRQWLKIKTKKLEEKSRLLEKEVAERTVTIVEQTQELERLGSAKTQFFTNVAHELRTPLTLTIAPLEEIIKEKYGAISPKVGDAISLVLRSARSMLNLVNQVLDLNKVESGEFSLNIQPVKLNNVVQLCASPFELLAKKRDISFQQDYEANEPQLMLDHNGIVCILNNLLSNAFKFTQSGGEVKLRVSYLKDLVIIKISDTGSGIAKEEIPFIFDHYYQASSQDIAPYSGTGIGLAMVKEYVDLHHGEVLLSSEEGVGTTFEVRLPLVVRASDNPVDSLPANIQSHTPEQKTNQSENKYDGSALETIGVDVDDRTTVLVVEDNIELLQFLVQHLSESYHVLEGSNGREGLEIANKQLPDVIVSDVMMPEMDGFTLCEKIKSKPETDYIPLLLLTSKSSNQDIVEGLNIGADDYLSKPFSIDELLARINRLIESRKLLRIRFSETDEALDEVSSSETPFYSSLKEIVLQQGANGISVGDLADKMAMDRTTLYRKIKTETGATPADTIRSIRLRHAATMLKGRPNTVSEIAYAIGFNSLGHFSRSFTAYFGETPTSYKARHSE